MLQLATDSSYQVNEINVAVLQPLEWMLVSPPRMDAGGNGGACLSGRGNGGACLSGRENRRGLFE